jgi:hypothetical protein
MGKTLSCIRATRRNKRNPVVISVAAAAADPEPSKSGRNGGGRR